MTAKKNPGAKPSRSEDRSDDATQAQGALQSKRDAADAKKASKKASPPSRKRALQAGPRAEPVNPLPAQHLSKPGLESQLELRPRYEAPAYRGSGKLEGMSAIVTGVPEVP